MRKKYVISVLAAGCLWGFMGMFTREMSDLGFYTTDILIIRCGVACAAFGLTLLIKDRKLFKVKLRDLWCFLGAGLCSLLFFTYCYFQCIRITSLSTAAILLYTAPSMVMVMSLVIFRERLTVAKIAALLMAFLGCCLVSGIGGNGVSVQGVLYGMGAGFGYALYSIFARFALNRGYDSVTINFYAVLFALAGACVLWDPIAPVVLMLSSGEGIIWSLCTGIISCYLPYLLYTYGMAGTETGKASVMASTEPIVATLVGIFVYAEQILPLSALGIALVIGAIFVLNIKQR